MLTKNCSVCHVEFTCGKEKEAKSCWCAELPMIMPAEFSQDCRCRSCLVQALVERIKESIKLNDHVKMVDIARHYRNKGKLTEHIDYTVENNNTVFSAWYHLKRGTCCGNGCKNCPY